MILQRFDAHALLLCPLCTRRRLFMGAYIQLALIGGCSCSVGADWWVLMTSQS